MATKLFLRNTTKNSIGSFRDMRTTAGSASTTGVVNTVASGTEIQWTKTAGGSVLEWISGDVPAGGFTLSGTMTFSIWRSESNNLANCGARARVFKRTLLGVETEVLGGPWDNAGEFTTSTVEDSWTGSPTSTVFAANDRIIVRYYIRNVGTMGGGRTCTITYDAADAATGDSFFQINETVAFVNEADVVVAATAVGVPTVTKSATFKRTLAATAVGVPAVGKTRFVTLSATTVGVPGLTTASVKSRSIAATAIGIAGLTVAPITAKSIAAVSVGVPAIIKTASLNIAATAVGVPAIGITRFVTVAATAVGIPNLTKTRNKSIAASATGAAAIPTKTYYPISGPPAVGVARSILQGQLNIVAKAIGAVVVDAQFISGGGGTTPISVAAVAIGVASMKVEATFLRVAAAVSIGVSKIIKSALLNQAATAVAIPQETLSVGKLISAIAHGSPSISVATTYSIILAAVAKGIANAVVMLVFLVTAAATAVGSVKIVRQAGKIIAAAAVGAMRVVRGVSLNEQTTAVGIPKETLQTNLTIQKATAVGVAAEDDAFTVGSKTAATAVGVPAVSVLFIPGGPPPPPSGEPEVSHNRVLLVRLGKWLLGR